MYSGRRPNLSHFSTILFSFLKHVSPLTLFDQCKRETSFVPFMLICIFKNIKTTMIIHQKKKMSHIVTKPPKWHLHPAKTQISLPRASVKLTYGVNYVLKSRPYAEIQDQRHPPYFQYSVLYAQNQTTRRPLQ